MNIKPNGKMRILLLITKAEDRLPIIEFIEEGGHTYMEAEDSEQALFLVKTYINTPLQPDVVIFDFGAYGKDRLEFAAELDRLNINVPMVALVSDNEALLLELMHKDRSFQLINRSDAIQSFMKMFAVLKE